MATSSFSQLTAASLDTVLASGTVVANGAYALCNAVDNRPTAGSVVSYDMADLRIPVTSLTPSAGGYITVSIFPAIDGGTVNYASPNAATAGPYSLALRTASYPAVALTELVILDIPIGPYSFKLQLLNGLGVSLTLAAIAQLQRKTLGSW